MSDCRYCGREKDPRWHECEKYWQEMYIDGLLLAIDDLRPPNTELNHCCALLIEAGISTGHGDSFTELVEECIANVVEARRNKV